MNRPKKKPTRKRVITVNVFNGTLFKNDPTIIRVDTIFNIAATMIDKTNVSKITFHGNDKFPIFVRDTIAEIANMIDQTIIPVRTMRLEARETEAALATLELHRDNLSIMLEGMRLLRRVSLDANDLYGQPLRDDLSDFFGYN